MSMSRRTRGFLLALVQVLLVAGVGATFLWDREHYPRAWVRTAPFDPELPIRGRYVRMSAVVTPETTGPGPAPDTFMARLQVRDGQLIAVADQAGRHRVARRTCARVPCWQLYEPLAYFIPEHVADPSRRTAGEELWVEVTVPPRGPPRPIRLGVRTGGVLRPL